MITGMIGMVFSVLAIFVLREPPRPSTPAPKKVEEKSEALINKSTAPKKPGCGDFIKGFGKATKELISNPTSRYCLMGSALRFFGGYSLAFYLPIYYQHIYTTYDKQFGVLNAVMASILAFLSALSGGILSDMYHSKTYMAKSYICILSSLLAAPPMALCCLI
jgi:nitrate/nitrite transporter NarK